LQFSSRELVNITAGNLVKLFSKDMNISDYIIYRIIKKILTKDVHDVLQVVQLGPSLDQVLDTLDRAPDSSWNLVDILRLHNSLQVVLEHLGKVVCAILVTVLVH